MTQQVSTWQKYGALCPDSWNDSLNCCTMLPCSFVEWAVILSSVLRPVTIRRGGQASSGPCIYHVSLCAERPVLLQGSCPRLPSMEWQGVLQATNENYGWVQRTERSQRRAPPQTRRSNRKSKLRIQDSGWIAWGSHKYKLYKFIFLYICICRQIKT
jgi:hypothetical protein